MQIYLHPFFMLYSYFNRTFFLIQQNFALEVAKLKAKKIKEGPKSEEEVLEALDELEANLDPTKVSEF